jgi:hypothetical protein
MIANRLIDEILNFGGRDPTHRSGLRALAAYGGSILGSIHTESIERLGMMLKKQDCRPIESTDTSCTAQTHDQV